MPLPATDTPAWPLHPDYLPDWRERNGDGPQLTLDDMAMLCMRAEHSYRLEWRHIGFIATMYAESRLYAWARPIVYAPGKEHHLTVDRGVCALNSFWWGFVDDEAAYDPAMAVRHSIIWLKAHAQDGTQGAKQWDWRPLLDWQWHAFGTDAQEAAVPEARAAINRIRAQGHDLAPI
jgi:hypothetical protein